MNRPGRIIFDACTLENFAVVGRLDLLQALYQDRSAWTDGTELEVRRGVAERPHLQALIGSTWLGPPIAADEPLALQKIDRIRRSLGGSPRLPTQHLGEAQIIHHISNVESSAIFATDDRDAYNLAQRRGMNVVETPDILRECFDAGLSGCPESFDLLHKMAAAGRGVAMPPNHWYICPRNLSDQ
jgi:predicted nucleic acid-binding protein